MKMNYLEIQAELSPVLKKYGLRFDASSNQLWPNYPIELLSTNIHPLQLVSVTETIGTKANLKHLRDHIQYGICYYDDWKRIQSEYRKTSHYKKIYHQYQFKSLAIKAGLNHDEHGTYGHKEQLEILDVAWKKKELKQYFAHGKYLGLVNQQTTTRYKGAFSGYVSSANHYFLVGTNENGVPFCHQVSNKIDKTVAAAIDWIWRNEQIEARQGDVAITASGLVNYRGEIAEVQIIDSHYAKGEIYNKNGQIHIKNGVIYHKKGQHEPICVNGTWKRILIAKRSGRNMSSHD